MKAIAIWLAVALMLAPVAFITTFMLSPLWSWIEATYGIESIGHSGPSDWCFELVYGLFLSFSLLLRFLLRNRKAREPSHG